MLSLTQPNGAKTMLRRDAVVTYEYLPDKRAGKERVADLIALARRNDWKPEDTVVILETGNRLLSEISLIS